MRWMKWAGLATAFLLMVSCFMTWVEVPSRQITISGVAAENTSFGKPGYFHLLMAILFIVFNFIDRIWAKRANFIVTALNLAWALRNYFLITACRAGECPEKHTGVYLMLAGSAVLLVISLFPDVKLPHQPEPKSTQE